MSLNIEHQHQRIQQFQYMVQVRGSFIFVHNYNACVKHGEEKTVSADNVVHGNSMSVSSVHSTHFACIAHVFKSNAYTTSAQKYIHHHHNNADNNNETTTEQHEISWCACIMDAIRICTKRMVATGNRYRYTENQMIYSNSVRRNFHAIFFPHRKSVPRN